MRLGGRRLGRFGAGRWRWGRGVRSGADPLDALTHANEDVTVDAFEGVAADQNHWIAGIGAHDSDISFSDGTFGGATFRYPL